MSTHCIYCKENEAPADMMPFCAFCIINLRMLTVDEEGESHLIYSAECDECEQPFFVTSSRDSGFSPEVQRHMFKNICFQCMQIDNDMIMYEKTLLLSEIMK